MSLFLSWLGFWPSTTPKSVSCLSKSPSDSYDSADSGSLIDQDEIIKIQKMEELSVVAAQIVQHIVSAHDELVLMKSYRPSDRVNRLLGGLVAVCCKIHDRETIRQVFDNEKIQNILPSLRDISSRSESDLESYWADKVIKEAESPDRILEKLRTFPYYINYEQLTRFELHAMLTAADAIPRKVAFLGSGPLPLSSLCFLDQVKELSLEDDRKAIQIFNIDMNGEAIRLSQNLIHALGPWGEGMHFVHGEAGAEGLDMSQFDVIHMAALVGKTQEEKEEIILKIAKQMKIGALMVVRSARGLRLCLYPEMDIESGSCEPIRKILHPCMVFHPLSRVVNSAIVLRKFDPSTGDTD